MALNFTVSYTFSPSTTISSSQVNTNTSDVASVFQGLEAETKTLAKLKVDIDPTLALEVATKQYVDHYSTYRRPTLQYNSGTVVNVETGLDGTSGDCTILFPDGSLRTDTATGRIQCNLAQVAALSGSWQSGLRTGTVAVNTWYAIYAVKTSDNSAHWVAVADTVIPTQGNFSTLNSNFGSNSWVYLGMIVYGNNKDVTNAIVSFVQVGNMTMFNNMMAITTIGTFNGITLAAASAVSSITYSYASGTTAGLVPAHLLIGKYAGCRNYDASGRGAEWTDSGGTILFGYDFDGAVSQSSISTFWMPLSLGIAGFDYNSSSGHVWDILLQGFVDKVLGVGSNPLL